MQYQTFTQPLDADRAFEALRRLQPVTPIRLIRQIVTVLAEGGPE